jgi:2-oxoisovalerate dehydrogenase E1 component
VSLERLRDLHRNMLERIERGPGPGQPPWDLDADLGRQLFESMLLARHVDLAALALHRAGHGVYTITSSGHESNVVLGRLTRVTDPTLLHYRSSAFFLERARQRPQLDAVTDLCLSLVAARSDPASGGRHKVFGRKELGIIPQTSTIASHLPRAVGLALGLERGRGLGRDSSWPRDAIAVAGFGDASINHSSWLGAVNAASWAVHQGIRVPLLLVCEDNGLGISVPSPSGWVQARLSSLPRVAYFHSPADSLQAAFRAASDAIAHCRHHRTPAVLHLECVRLLGHWATDSDETYRAREELSRAVELDPLPRLALALVAAGVATSEEVLDWDRAACERVRSAADRACEEPRLTTREEIEQPIVRRPVSHAPPALALSDAVDATRELTLRAGIQAALSEALTRYPHLLLFGEDVARKGGVHGVTQGLAARFGKRRVFDTLLDEQTILGLGLGLATLGQLPVPEIQYLAFLHNALDQLRGEAATLPFLSAGAYDNPMVVRIASFADPRAPGGHFHNDNGVAPLRDIPGLVLAVPARADDALALYRTAFELADVGRRVVVVLEPTALYGQRDLCEAGDRGWLAAPPPEAAALGRARIYGRGPADLVLASYGRGVWLSLRTEVILARSYGIRARVVDLRWLAPLPIDDLLAELRDAPRLLVVDECRRTGGVAESIAAALLERAPGVAFARVSAADCFIPIGPAAKAVLPTEEEIVQVARSLCERCG